MSAAGKGRSSDKKFQRSVKACQSLRDNNDFDSTLTDEGIFFPSGMHRTQETYEVIEKGLRRAMKQNLEIADDSTPSKTLALKDILSQNDTVSENDIADFMGGNFQKRNGFSPPGTLRPDDMIHRTKESVSESDLVDQVGGFYINNDHDHDDDDDDDVDYESIESPLSLSTSRSSINSHCSACSAPVITDKSFSQKLGKRQNDTFPVRVKSDPGKNRLQNGRSTLPRARVPLSWSIYGNSSSTSCSSNSSISGSSGGGSKMKSGSIGNGNRRLSDSGNKKPTDTENAMWKQGKMLGSGIFGQVYICHELNSGREMVAKLVEISSDHEEVMKEVKDLKCEIQLLKSLEHERIIKYYGSYDDQRILSIFMEYMYRGSVTDHIKENGPLTENVTRSYSRQIVDGLSYLHRLEIEHRTIKGSNILRDHRGNVKLGDYGIIKRLQIIVSKSVEDELWRKTPHYLAPEVVDCRGQRYGRSADIWSLGCTVVEMLTGQPPWHELSNDDVLVKIANHNPPYYVLQRMTSESAKVFISACLCKNSADRPSAEKLLKDIFIASFEKSR